MLLFSCFFVSSLIIFDSVYYSIDNEYFPEKIRILLVVALLFLSIAIRFDFLKGEWKTHLSFYKFYYHLEQNNSFEHGLTEENYKKLSILAKFTKIILFKGCVFQ